LFFNGKVEKKAACDLVIVDYPDGMSIPRVYDPPTQVPDWNALSPKFLRNSMTF
jgi:hypothetical protein